MSERLGGGIDQMNEEAEMIRQAISRFTEAEYEFSEPLRDFPSPKKDIVWLIVSPFQLSKRTHSPAPFIWEDKSGIIHVESAQLGNTIEWVEQSYGEKGAIKVSKMALDFSKPEFRREFKKLFSMTYRRLSSYEKILGEVSSMRATSLSMNYERYQHMVTFYAVATFDVKGLHTQTKIEKINLSIEAIKEALSEIDKYEAKRVTSGD